MASSVQIPGLSFKTLATAPVLDESTGAFKETFPNDEHRTFHSGIFQAQSGPIQTPANPASMQYMLERMQHNTPNQVASTGQTLAVRANWQRSPSREEGEVSDIGRALTSPPSSPEIRSRKRKASSPLQDEHFSRTKSSFGPSHNNPELPILEHRRYRHLRNSEKAALGIITVLLENGYESASLIQDIADAACAIRQQLFHPTTNHTITEHVTSEEELQNSVLSANNPNSHPQISSHIPDISLIQPHATIPAGQNLNIDDEKQHIPTKAKTAVEQKRPQSRAEYMAKLEALKTKKTSDDSLPKQKVERQKLLMQKIAALKAQNSLQTALPSESPSTPLYSAVMSAISPAPHRLQQMDDLRVKRRPTASDLIEVGFTNERSRNSMGHHHVPNLYNFDTGPNYDESLIIEASDSSSNEEMYSDSEDVEDTAFKHQDSDESEERLARNIKLLQPVGILSGPAIDRQRTRNTTPVTRIETSMALTSPVPAKSMAGLLSEIETLNASIAAREKARLLKSPLITTPLPSTIIKLPSKLSSIMDLEDGNHSKQDIHSTVGGVQTLNGLGLELKGSDTTTLPVNTIKHSVDNAHTSKTFEDEVLTTSKSQMDALDGHDVFDIADPNNYPSNESSFDDSEPMDMSSSDAESHHETISLNPTAQTESKSTPVKPTEISAESSASSSTGSVMDTDSDSESGSEIYSKSVESQQSLDGNKSTMNKEPQEQEFQVNVDRSEQEEDSTDDDRMETDDSDDDDDDNDDDDDDDNGDVKQIDKTDLVDEGEDEDEDEDEYDPSMIDVSMAATSPQQASPTGSLVDSIAAESSPIMSQKDTPPMQSVSRGSPSASGVTIHTESGSNSQQNNMEKSKVGHEVAHTKSSVCEFLHVEFTNY